jgi:predicted Zn-dependent peptidase
MLVLNEILGGYFGSRLMKNIREDKGLTYGISSQMAGMVNEGFFVIGADVKAENTELALAEIYKEIDILKNELVPESELNTVKNYIIGSYLANLSNPFLLADYFKSIYFLDMDYQFYDNFIPNIRKIKAIDIQKIAQKYFDQTSFTEVVVGNTEVLNKKKASDKKY